MTEQTLRPVLRTEADVEKFWTTICRPLGWRTPELWVVLVAADGETLPTVQQIAELPVEPDQVALGNLAAGCRRLLEEFAPGGRVATLLCRPGGALTTAFDRTWCSALAETFRAEGVVLEVTHVASDVAITPMPLDAVG